MQDTKASAALIVALKLCNYRKYHNVIKLIKIIFDSLFLPARRYASAGLCDSDVSVCPSVRPPHAGIVPSRAKAGS